MPSHKIGRGSFFQKAKIGRGRFFKSEKLDENCATQKAKIGRELRHSKSKNWTSKKLDETFLGPGEIRAIVLGAVPLARRGLLATSKL